LQIMPKILIFHTSVGLGHKAMAENIGFALQQAGFTVKLADILQVEEGKLVSFGKGLHHLINKYLPWLWEFLYKSSWVADLAMPLRVKLASKHSGRALSLIKEFNPDAIISTQTTSSAAVSFLKAKGLYGGPFIITFSDFHLHRFWLYDNCDHYLANIEEQKKKMLSLGIAPEKITVCGITMKPRLPVDIIAVKAKFNVAPEEKVVLVGIGSLGIGFRMETLRELLELENTKIIVVCGKNEKLYEHLKKRAKHKDLTVLGFYKPMDELYAIADVFITKPGGMSVSESLKWSLPVIVTHQLPGQESLNCEYLKNKDLAEIKPKDLTGSVRAELSGHSIRKKLQFKLSQKDSLVQFGEPVVQAVQNFVAH